MSSTLLVYDVLMSDLVLLNLKLKCCMCSRIVLGVKLIGVGMNLADRFRISRKEWGSVTSVNLKKFLHNVELWCIFFIILVCVLLISLRLVVANEIQ